MPKIALCILLLMAGAANTLAFAPYSLWWLPFITLAILVWCTGRANHSKISALYGLCYGIGWFGVGISWVHVSIDQFGGLPFLAGLGVMALLVAYLALFPAFACWLYRKYSSPLLSALLFAACWTLAEALRGWLFTGFPWLSLGYSQTNHGLQHWAPLIGETGISFLLAFIAAIFAGIIQKHAFLTRFAYPVIAGCLLLVSPYLTLFKGWHTQESSVSVALVQGNIKQEMRWIPEQEWPAMLKYLDLSEPYLNTDLIIWPEAAIPQLEPIAGGYLSNLDSKAFTNNTTIITGIIDYHFKTQQAWNNLIVVGKRNSSDAAGHYGYNHSNRYSKHHLLPIGEFVPFENWLRKLAPLFDLPMSSFSRGDYIQSNLLANGYHILPAICFEIAFAQQISANFTAKTQILLTVSNDAWFGDSIGPHQHLQIAQMRAAEFGRPLLRATNNGITATIDASGQIQKQLPQFTEAVLQDEIQLTSGQTPYSIIGNWPLLGLSVLIFSIAFLRSHRKN